MSGNYKTRRRISTFKTIMKTLGLEDERVELRWISAAESKKFAETARELTARAEKLGPNPMATTSMG